MKKIAAAIFSVFLWCVVQPWGYCEVINYGNTKIRVVIKTEDGRSVSRDLFPEQEIPLPEDAVEVKVDSFEVQRGDAEVYVIVTTTDGATKEIHNYGGVCRLKP
jgi:hypothetical protein